MLLIVNMLFSIKSSISSNSSINYECGFLPLFSSNLTFKYHYWSSLIHFILYEQELILALLLVFGALSSSNLIVVLLLCMLFVDLFL
jgi:NADH:ubiquinone oxidoreductase subunit 3 (subunit A)